MAARDAYAGFRLPQPAPSGKPWMVPVLSGATTTAHSLYHAHIAVRKPAIIRGLPADSDLGALLTQLTPELLADAAGDAAVHVEVAAAGDDAPEDGREFGRGKRVLRPLNEVLDELAAGAALYISTQPEDSGWRSAGPPPPGRVHISAPLPALVDSGLVPIRPALAGSLVPQSMHLWLGSSASGSSSGLHHDFHDNIYVLAAGRKRFTLFDPSAAGALATYGELAGVAPNGRINYVGAGPVDENGAPLADVEAWRTKSALATAKDDDDIDAALERMLDMAAGGRKRKRKSAAAGDDDGDDDFPVFDGEWPDEWADEWADDDSGGPGTASSQQASVAAAPPAAAVAKTAAEPEPEPDHFSRIPTPAVHARHGPKPWPLVADAPLFDASLPHAVAELSAGDVLYLPAGWFHEVTSFSDKPRAIHMAVNYWFHPPSMGARADAPYATEYWPSMFADAHADDPPPAKKAKKGKRGKR
ncbi:JmjC domain-containing protein 4 [Thecamonas trahens ATCC 50062]|uniref:JmjC domain-containing protein 4 n=1 Tax=Thecamonas trahens ATCC 50062 TaxID=461836 RepID=A0A0L0DS32_THETB|nr:JmjC domain-containing protein 4 [Thecamonas trahens ATCC 50062]KNC54851.1 JmjC domain-containing protein 4 [Thecamonas trahens ATCC 50062]|eukprot:XP_013761748.1 JmjC domain-containing protein 4 [Thecamonas trahens ATCC 50062]